MLAEEVPPPPVYLDPEGHCEDLAAEVSLETVSAVIATDGSNIGGVHRIGVSGIFFPLLGKRFATPVPGEDQSAYKAELHAVWFALGMILVARPRSLQCVHLLCDCEAALRAITGEGDCALHGLVCAISDRRAQLLHFGVATVLHWVSSHGKRPQKWAPWSGAPPALQQAWNAEADSCAVLEGTRLRRCALRGPWHDRRGAATAWEVSAIRLAAMAAERLAM